MKISLAIALLISNTSAVSHKSTQNLQEQSGTQTLTELNRYIGGNGQPINLAETSGHARLELTKVRKYNKPVDVSNIGLDKTTAAGPNDWAINKPGEKVTAHI